MRKILGRILGVLLLAFVIGTFGIPKTSAQAATGGTAVNSGKDIYIRNSVDKEIERRCKEAVKNLEAVVDVSDLNIECSEREGNLFYSEILNRSYADENLDFFYTNEYFSKIENGKLKTIYIRPYEDLLDKNGKPDTKKIYSMRDEYIREIKKAFDSLGDLSKASDVEKALVIHDYIAMTADYESEHLINTIANPRIGSTYGAIIDHNIVCAGYAQAFEKLGKMAGLNCFTIFSRNHAWNIIEIDGQWYHIDTTWDDGPYVEWDGGNLFCGRL